MNEFRLEDGVITIRKYKPGDCAAMAKLFYDTVHTINAMDYTKEQLNVWAKEDMNLEIWNSSFLNNKTLIAEINGEIVGFADMDNSGYLDRLYVHKDFQRRGIAAALLNKLERCARKSGILSFETYASITARPFFEKQGYIVEEENRIIRDGITLVNYKMVKSLKEWHKLEDDMSDYILAILNEDYAKEICTWKYDEEYSVYNLSDWDLVVENGWNLAIKEKRESDFVAILSDNELIAYGRLTAIQDKAFIGIGLKPSLCGQGIGGNVMKLLIEECRNRFPDCLIALEVRIFNTRAIRCYENIGFEIKKKYCKDTLTGNAEFYLMEQNSINWRE